MATYPMHVAGLDRDFPICKVTDDLYIGAFIMFGDAELTVRCAEELLKLAEGIDYDYLFTAEAKSIPLIHEMARQSGAKKYFIARKGPKVYMPDPISVEDKSITTVAQQKLFLGSDDADLIRGKKILLVDDVISTGGSLKAMEALVEKAGGTVTGRMAVLAEGGAADRKVTPWNSCARSLTCVRVPIPLVQCSAFVTTWRLLFTSFSMKRDFSISIHRLSQGLTVKVPDRCSR